MTDLRDRFRELDRLQVPDILARTRSIGPRPPMPEPGPTIATRLGVVALALLVFGAAAFLGLKAVRHEQPVSTPQYIPCAPGSWGAPVASAVSGTSVWKVVARSPTDAWVLTRPAGSRHPLLHLTAGGWQTIVFPESHIWDLAVSASGTVWALGDTALWTFDGQRWSSGTLPERLMPGGLLFVSAPDDVWVAGVPAGTSASAMWHWDGSSWQNTSIPGGSVIQMIGGVTSTDFWAIGVHQGVPLSLHWDGSTWTAIPMPAASFVPPRYSWGGHLVALTGHDVWVSTGSRLLHWDGTAWKIVAIPPVVGSKLLNPHFSDFTAGHTGVWLWNNGRLSRWDGTSWSRIGQFPYSQKTIGDYTRLAVVQDGLLAVHAPGDVTALTYACGRA
jgi:hypothetical protein